MKLLTAKKRKIAIIFTGGLGDTLLFVPLLKELKKKQFNITCVFYARGKNDCLFDENLFDHKLYINNKAGLFFFALKNWKRFVNFYINHLGNGRAIYLAAAMSSSRVTRTAVRSQKNSRLCRNIAVEAGLSDAAQNLHLLYTVSNARINDIRSFYLMPPRQAIDVKQDAYIIQVSAGNNTTPFKNWPMENWISIVTKLCATFKNSSFIIVGDAFETGYANAFEKLNLPNCKVLIGKTSVTEVFGLVASAKGYIGLDSGIMHMAVALQKKTVTLFGASDEKLYGYAQLDNAHHLVITSSISCRPCAAWKNANTSRVADPMQCPDFACLTGISEATVYDSIVAHFNLH